MLRLRWLIFRFGWLLVFRFGWLLIFRLNWRLVFWLGLLYVLFLWFILVVGFLFRLRLILFVFFGLRLIFVDHHFLRLLNLLVFFILLVVVVTVIVRFLSCGRLRVLFDGLFLRLIVASDTSRHVIIAVAIVVKKISLGWFFHFN